MSVIDLSEELRGHIVAKLDEEQAELVSVHYLTEENVYAIPVCGLNALLPANRAQQLALAEKIVMKLNYAHAAARMSRDIHEIASLHLWDYEFSAEDQERINKALDEIRTVIGELQDAHAQANLEALGNLLERLEAFSDDMEASKLAARQESENREEASDAIIYVPAAEVAYILERAKKLPGVKIYLTQVGNTIAEANELTAIDPESMAAMIPGLMAQLRDRLPAEAYQSVETSIGHGQDMVKALQEMCNSPNDFQAYQAARRAYVEFVDFLNGFNGTLIGISIDTLAQNLEAYQQYLGEESPQTLAEVEDLLVQAELLLANIGNIPPLKAPKFPSFQDVTGQMAQKKFENFQKRFEQEKERYQQEEAAATQAFMVVYEALKERGIDLKVSPYANWQDRARGGDEGQQPGAGPSI